MPTSQLSQDAAKLLANLDSSGLFRDLLGEHRIHETHISLVLIGKARVLKFKKNLDLGFLDYSSTQKRWEACCQEVLLNRRFSSDIYLGVLPIYDRACPLRNSATIVDPADNESPPDSLIDSAVLMRTIAEDSLMESMIKNDSIVVDRDVAALAAKVSEFHLEAMKTAQRKKISDDAEPAIVRAASENFRVLEELPPQSLKPQQKESLKSVRKYSNRFAKKNAEMFHEREVSGYIVDGHGDLRAEHVAFEDKALSLIDCIEFNPALRCVDVLNEIAFLCMDLDRLERHDLSADFADAYLARVPWVEHSELFRFFLCYRAMVRAKVEALKALQKGLALDDLSSDFDCYLSLACRYARNFPAPSLVAIGGKMGVGKSTLAAALKAQTAANLIQSDSVRKELFKNETESKSANFGHGIYSAEATVETYDSCFKRAAKILSHGQPVILDSSFAKREHRDRAQALADEYNCRFVFVSCELSRELTFERLAMRESDPSAISDGRREIYDQQSATFENLDSDELPRSIQIDMRHPALELVSAVLALILE